MKSADLNNIFVIHTPNPHKQGGCIGGVNFYPAAQLKVMADAAKAKGDQKSGNWAKMVSLEVKGNYKDNKVPRHIFNVPNVKEQNKLKREDLEKWKKEETDLRKRGIQKKKDPLKPAPPKRQVAQQPEDQWPQVEEKNDLQGQQNNFEDYQEDLGDTIEQQNDQQQDIISDHQKDQVLYYEQQQQKELDDEQSEQNNDQEEIQEQNNDQTNEQFQDQEQDLTQNQELEQEQDQELEQAQEQEQDQQQGSNQQSQDQNISKGQDENCEEVYDQQYEQDEEMPKPDLKSQEKIYMWGLNAVKDIEKQEESAFLDYHNEEVLAQSHYSEDHIQESSQKQGIELDTSQQSIKGYRSKVADQMRDMMEDFE